MPVLFDATSGRLRLDAGSFDVLSGWVTGHDTTPAALEPLRAAGVIVRGRPHELLMPGLVAVGEPLCTVEITIEDAGRNVESGRGWVCDDAAALLLDLPDELHEFVTVHPTFLPAALARVVRLGPRPRTATMPLQVRNTLLDELLSADESVRATAVDALIAETPEGERELTAEAARALGSGLSHRWRVRIEWTAPDGSPGGRGIRVLDTAAGLWITEPTVGVSVVWPTTPSAVWRTLISLMPTEADIPS
ncbi:hypothetical protein [Fodinicola acaciae]|uniref:hypothetical protein n=1 Tax=Fodinicola acaciae TaxID=2681555 RepID=UPI0013D56396|nr:hypothetical protein [Fodinicola acaciae]